jgi:hypothetical protein
MAKVSITVNKPYYHPGDVVEGIVHVDVPKDQKVRGITLDSEGLEWTEIKVTHYSGRYAHTHTYVSKNSMQKFGCLLCGETELAAGSHKYPFQYKLPTQLLPTFHGHWARVVYLIRANLDIPHWFDANQTIEIPVIIPQGSVKLDMRPMRLQSPRWGDPSRPSFIADFERTQWLAGDSVRGVLQLTGDGGKRIRKADIALQMVEWANAQGYTRDAVNEVSSTSVPGEPLMEGKKMPFRVPIPRRTYTSYKGRYSYVKWVLDINLDVAWGFDIDAAQEMVIVKTD